MEVEGGYVVLTPGQLANGLHLIEDAKLPWRVMRTYLACFELVAIREAAGRTRKGRRGEAGHSARFHITEFQRVTGLAPETIRKALAELKRVGIVDAGPECIVISRVVLPGAEALAGELACARSVRRPIPVPRRLIRHLAAQSSAAIGKTGLGYITRGLSFRRGSGDIVGRGTMKASWVVEVLGVSLRSVRYAQEALRSDGWITKDNGSTQRKLNRTGAYFEVRLDGPLPAESTAVPAIGKRGKPVLESAPLGASERHGAAPPIEDSETPSELENQEALPTEGAGVYGTTGSEPLGEGRAPALPTVGERVPRPTPLAGLRPEETPTWNNIRPGDLHHLERMEALYFQAVGAGWVQAGEARAIDFVAAAIRAREVGREPVRVFVAIARRGLWSHITQAQEDRARRVLSRYREQRRECFRLSGASSVGQPLGGIRGQAVLNTRS